MKASEVPMGGCARIVSILIDGAERRRLMDLGFCPGTEMHRVLEAPLGGTTAFRIRSTVIALRNDQLDGIEVSPC